MVSATETRTLKLWSAAGYRAWFVPYLLLGDDFSYPPVATRALGRTRLSE
jgi:hypothetical protein